MQEEFGFYKIPRGHDGGRDGTRINPANAAGNREQQDAGRGIARREPEDASQQAKGIRQRENRNGVLARYAAWAARKTDDDHDRAGAPVHRGVVAGLFGTSSSAGSARHG